MLQHLTLVFSGTTFNNHRITFPATNFAGYFNRVSGVTLPTTNAFIFGWEPASNIAQGEGFGANATSRIWFQGGAITAITDYVDGLVSTINSISTDAAGTEGTLNEGANRTTLQRLCVATRGVGNSIVLTLLDDTRIVTPDTANDFASGIADTFVQSTSVAADKTYETRFPILHSEEAYICILGYDATSSSTLPAVDTTHWKPLT